MPRSADRSGEPTGPSADESDTARAGTQLAPQPGRLVVIQRNPHSGSGRGRSQLLRLTAELRQRGFRVRLFSRRQQLERFMARPAVQAELRCLVAAGGDGTVADLASRFPGTPLAILPLGTENLMARHLRITRCGRTLARLIDQFQIRTFDNGTADGHRFLLMLSVGTDAEIIRRLHVRRTGHIGYHSYLLPVICSLTGYTPPRLLARSDDGLFSVAGSHVIVTNTPEYGFGFRFSPDAQPDDGLLDVRVFTGSGRLLTMLHAVMIFLRLSAVERSVVRFRTAALTLTALGASRPLPVQCDGDPGPSVFPGQPVQIRVVRNSLALISPSPPGGVPSAERAG